MPKACNHGASTATLALLAAVGGLAVMFVGEASQSSLRWRSGELLQLGDCARSGGCIIGVDRRALMERGGSAATLRTDNTEVEEGARLRVSTSLGLQQDGPAAAPAVPEEIKVVLMTESWFSPELFAFHNTNPCAARGQPLVCRFGDSSQLDPKAADALWWHTPHLNAGYRFPQRAFTGQAFVSIAVEPASIFGHLASASFMRNFDISASYRLDSELPIVAQPFDIRTSDEVALPDFGGRQAAVWFVQKNCGSTSNGRTRIVKALMARHGVPVHAMGKCLTNRAAPPGTGRSSFPENHKWQQAYRVCIAMENSNSEDYVTEKVWNALRAGCVPVYQGAPNARADFLPANSSAIFVEDFKSVKALAAEIKRVLTDQAAWEGYMAWRALPFEQLNAGYRSLLSKPTDIPTCRLCQLLADRKRSRRNSNNRA